MRCFQPPHRRTRNKSFAANCRANESCNLFTQAPAWHVVLGTKSMRGVASARAPPSKQNRKRNQKMTKHVNACSRTPRVNLQNDVRARVHLRASLPAKKQQRMPISSVVCPGSTDCRCCADAGEHVCAKAFVRAFARADMIGRQSLIPSNAHTPDRKWPPQPMPHATPPRNPSVQQGGVRD